MISCTNLNIAMLATCNYKRGGSIKMHTYVYILLCIHNNILDQFNLIKDLDNPCVINIFNFNYNHN